jgi:hypothetical protein
VVLGGWVIETLWVVWEKEESGRDRGSDEAIDIEVGSGSSVSSKDRLPDGLDVAESD